MFEGEGEGDGQSCATLQPATANRASQSMKRGAKRGKVRRVITVSFKIAWAATLAGP